MFTFGNSILVHKIVVYRFGKFGVVLSSMFISEAALLYASQDK